MEKQFFTFEDWDPIAEACYLYRCTVVASFGPYKIGDILSRISMNYQDGIIEVYNTEEDENPSWSGKLKLVIE